MRPEDVRFHHIRDWKWRMVWCDRCKRLVPWFHGHYTKPGESVSAVDEGKP
jgi:hypothetical protein